MQVIELTKIASKLYKANNYKSLDLMHELYSITKGLHPKDDIEPILSKELAAYLKTTKVKEIEKTVIEFWRWVIGV